MIITDKRLTAIILAAGAGSRMNMSITKQRIEICGETVLHRTLNAFNSCKSVSNIVVVTREDEIDFAKNEAFQFDKVKDVVIGGGTRAESAAAGFSVAEQYSDYVAIHDGARCFVTNDIIEAVFSDAVKHGAATASSVVTDTVKAVNKDGFVTETVDRDTVRLVQTPQIFKTELYKQAIDNSIKNKISVTDDNMLLENIGIKPYCTDTGVTNIKITTREDLIYAKCLLEDSYDSNAH